jgi:hypothetical protein
MLTWLGTTTNIARDIFAKLGLYRFHCDSLRGQSTPCRRQALPMPNAERYLEAESPGAPMEPVMSSVAQPSHSPLLQPWHYGSEGLQGIIRSKGRHGDHLQRTAGCPF